MKGTPIDTAQSNKRLLGRCPTWAVGLYVVCLVAIWLTIYFGADRWWLATLMMFGPKWVYALPIPVLVVWIIAARVGRRAWLLLTVSGLLLLFPIGGFCVPWRTLAVANPPEICLLTCNTGGDRCDAARLSALLTEVRPDVVCLQECSQETEQILDEGWQVVRAGALIVAARGEVTRLDVLKRNLPGRWPRVIGLLVRVTRGGRSFDVATLHLFSPRDGLAEIASSRSVIAPWRRETLLQQTDYRRTENQQASRWLAQRPEPLLIAGDLNTPVRSSIYRESWGTQPNAFSQAGLGFGHTVEINQGGFRFSNRIDHVLASDDWQCSQCWVGPEVGSDHWPLIARYCAG